MTTGVQALASLECTGTSCWRPRKQLSALDGTIRRTFVEGNRILCLDMQHGYCSSTPLDRCCKLYDGSVAFRIDRSKTFKKLVFFASSFACAKNTVALQLRTLSRKGSMSTAATTNQNT